jgi:T5SS/PEP-CTERM-associated repeat protein
MGSVVVEGSGTVWDPSSTVVLGGAGEGSLTVGAGGTLSGRVIVGESTNGVGTIAVSGLNAQWTNATNIVIGDSGTGNLVVSKGAKVDGGTFELGKSASGNGYASLDGPGSQWNSSQLRIGVAGTGNLIATNQSVLTTSGTDVSVIGDLNGSVGSMLFFDSQWESDDGFFIGHEGVGELQIRDGSIVTNSGNSISRVGSDPGSVGTVIVDGPGSQWNLGGNLVVGNNGTGSMSITNGAVVNSAQSNIGGDQFGGSGGMGSVVVSGADSQWNSNSIFAVGYDGDGTLDVSNGGSVSSTLTWVGWKNGSSGNVSIDGAASQWDVSASLNIGGAGVGSVAISGGNVSIANGLNLNGNGSSLTINGGAVQTTSFSRQGNFQFNSGQLTINGGVFDNHGDDLILDGLSPTDIPDLAMVGASSSGFGNLTVGGANRGVLEIFDGSLVSNNYGTVGSGTRANGYVVVNGPGSTWINLSTLEIGKFGDGVLAVAGGGSVANTAGYIGREQGSDGLVELLNGSNWTNSSVLHVGYQGNGSLGVFSTSSINADSGQIGSMATGEGNVTVSDAELNLTDSLVVGNGGTGSLDVNGPGALVSSSLSYIGNHAGSDGLVLLQSGAQWHNSGNLTVAKEGNGQLSIHGATLNVGGTLTIGHPTGNGPGLLDIDQGGIVRTHSLIHTGTIALNDGLLEIDGGTYTYNNSSGLLSINGTGSPTLRLLNGANTTGLQDTILHVGLNGPATLEILSGSAMNIQTGALGGQANGNGQLSVSGTQSSFSASDSLLVGVLGTGTLSLTNGGTASSNTLSIGFTKIGSMLIAGGSKATSNVGSIGRNAGATGNVVVNGANSQWSMAELEIGREGSGSLTVTGGGIVDVANDGYLGRFSDGAGNILVQGNNSRWIVGRDLNIGTAGSGILVIGTGGRVSVGATTSIGAFGSVGLNGGRFEFGTTTLDEFNAINATSGSMAGIVNHAGYTDFASLGTLRSDNVDLSDVGLRNTGTLYGDGTVDVSLINEVNGVVETVSSERMRFAGQGNINQGEINSAGGTIRFAQDLLNTSTGFVSGRGVFEANAGWKNEGVMAFSAGITDIRGDLFNLDQGQIVTSGGATTTFFDDVVHNGLEIRTASGSHSVFLGGASGAGRYTGTGSVFFEGDLRPGNSPDIVVFEGSVVLGSEAYTYLELGGVEIGQFDQLLIEGDYFLDGNLVVDLIDGFTLQQAQEFLIADVSGVLSGQFNGLAEGDLVGNYRGIDLFITYKGGDGNDVGLFTPVPEPGVVGFLACLFMGLCLHRPDRNQKNQLKQIRAL